MATGLAAAAPTIQNYPFDAQINLAPIGSSSDTQNKLLIAAIGVTPLPNNTLQGHGQGIYTNITA